VRPDRSRSDRSRTPLKPSPKPEARSALERINDLIESLQKQPLWGYAGWLFLLCVPFAAIFFYNAPDWRANFDQQGVVFHRAEAAGNDLNHITHVVGVALVSPRSAVINYDAIFPGKNVGDPLDQQKLVQGQNLIRTSLSQIDVAKAALSTADFPDATLNTYSKSLVQDLQNQQTRMENMGRLYAAALKSDGPSISAALVDVRTDNGHADAVGEAALDDLAHFRQEGDRFYEQTEIDVRKFTEKIILFYLYEALAWGAAIYSALFLMLVLYALAKQLLKPNSGA
jgi:hypothetical protein